MIEWDNEQMFSEIDWKIWNIL